MEYGVYIAAGNIRSTVFSGSEKECEDFVSDLCPNWTWRDANGFVWDVEIDRLPS